MDLKKYLNTAAKSDLAMARKNGHVCVIGTKRGNIEIEYKNNGWYIIHPFNNPDYAYYAGRAAGAVKFLTESYEVVNG